MGTPNLHIKKSFGMGWPPVRVVSDVFDRYSNNFL